MLAYKSRKVYLPALAAITVTAALGQLNPSDDSLELARTKNYEAERVSSRNPDPGSNDDSKRLIPGQTLVVADLKGPGVVNHIWMTVAANEYGWPRLVRLRVYYDGSLIPGVDAPLGDFFGVGHGQERQLESLMIRDSSNGRARNSYWRMPFRKACRITLTNEGHRRVASLYYHIDWKKVPSLPADVGYLHAWYKQELPAQAHRNYEVLNIKGRGTYVGTVLNVIQSEAGWFGEGDELFFIDGEQKPRIEGTGTEDYFNEAWGLRISLGPYTGVTIAGGRGIGARLSAYRWHLPDPIPFRNSIRFEMEHAGWTYHPDGTVRSAFEERADLFSSVAFWYQIGNSTLPEPPYGEARLPHGNARQIEVEDSVAQTKVEAGTVRVDKEVFWSRDLLVFHGEGPGSKVHIPFDVEETGRYELISQIAHRPDYGIYTYLLDGKPIEGSAPVENKPGTRLPTGAPSQIDAYYVETYVAEDHLLGWTELTKGRHVLTFECVGKNQASRGFDLGIDALILAQIGRTVKTGGAKAAAIRQAGMRAEPVTVVELGLKDGDPQVQEAAAWAFTQMPVAARASLPKLQDALADPDPRVRGLIALAISNCGGCAKAALPMLAARLKDPDEDVRLSAADALASAGPDAAPAVPQLIAAASRPGEQNFVLYNVAKALGNIGAAARPALPLLDELAQRPRVQWAAREALIKIRTAQ